MPRFVVLLRGINVGRHKRIAMADLRELLADLGHTDVRTVLNSGNAVTTADDDPLAEHAARIERAITERLGLTVPTIVLTADALRAIATGNPFDHDDGSRMMVHVLAQAPDDPEHTVAADPVHARVVDRVIYQWCPDGLLAAPGIGWPGGVPGTTRNWNTITKLAALLEEPSRAARAGRRRPAGRPDGA